MKLLRKVFSLRNENREYKVLWLFGIKFRFIRDSYITSCLKLLEYFRVPGFSPVSSLYGQMQSVVHTALLHQKSFSDLRYINVGKDVVLCATGPTLDYYSPIEGAVHIGVKDAFKIERIKFDYLFHHDVSGYKSKIIPGEFINYRAQDCIKFIGNSVPFLIGENPTANKIRFFNSANTLNYQIDYLPLPDYGSIIFPAFFFALWTKPKRIFIVGADCSTGHASGANVEHFSDVRYASGGWKLMKDFADKYYPDVELISINPVGLKGMFKDVYTNDYLNTEVL